MYAWMAGSKCVLLSSEVRKSLIIGSVNNTETATNYHKQNAIFARIYSMVLYNDCFPTENSRIPKNGLFQSDLLAC